MSPKRDPTRAIIRAAAREAKSRFDIAHRKGMKALREGDLLAFDDAIAEERAAIESFDLATKRIRAVTGH
ncbi:MAG TPA: hypothetical protein VM166_00565 [Gemmatimonadaceae bacterium]|nr:hypothetical protein [Gemmatimonadaceae bacterium]